MGIVPIARAPGMLRVAKPARRAEVQAARPAYEGRSGGALTDLNSMENQCVIMLTRKWKEYLYSKMIAKAEADQEQQNRRNDALS